MITTKQQRQTELTELVEIHNIVKSVRRIRNVPGYDSQRVRRAIYQAMLMAGGFSNTELKAVRETFQLP